MTDHWVADHIGHDQKTGWTLFYDPTPGGERQADGSMNYSMRFPALNLTDWVSEPERIAGELAHDLNSHDDVVAALKKAQALIIALLPGVAHIALQDYAALNETPIAIAAALAKAGEA